MADSHTKLRSKLNATNSISCYCGAQATIKSNSVKYGREYGNVPYAYICDRFPACDGYVGVHPDGSPLGTIADKVTQRWRMAVHAQIDPLWRERTDRSKSRNRASVYGWLRRLMNMTSGECHVGNFTAEQCIEALEQIALHPYELKHQEWGNDLLKNSPETTPEVSDAPETAPGKDRQ